ncbi:MAG TPA: hypothetical protein VFS75_00825 [Candidatus Paceibacterota bacterium]|nr:hypothetical protein [Candidatus Paceibacterota bacterium]
MKIIAYLLPLVLIVPMSALAAGEGQLGTVSTFITNIVNFINRTLVPFIFALAFLVFLWGVFKTFILGGSDEGKQEEGKKLMMYAIAGFVIMVSLWGIVNLVAKGFGFTNEDITPLIPKTPDVH